MAANPLDLDPQVLAAQEIVKGLKELKPVTKEILDQFGISADDNYQGLIPLGILMIPVAKELKDFLHNMLILQHQVMSYLETLGADIKSAEDAVITNPVSSDILGWFMGGMKL